MSGSGVPGPSPPRAAVPYDELRTGDVMLMDRKCLAMKDPLGMALCLLTKIECPYDHVAMLVKLTEDDLQHHPNAGQALTDANCLSPSGTYVLETNRNGVTLRPLEARLERSSANEIATRLLHCGAHEHAYHQRLLAQMEDMFRHPYSDSLWDFIPPMLCPPDKVDRIGAAHCVSFLEGELEQIADFARGCGEAEAVETLRQLAAVYTDALRWLCSTYFPHVALPEPGAGAAARRVDLSANRFFVDGTNHASSMFCAQLIVHLWQTTGVVSAFPPASAFRAFDFLEDVRFNFVDPGVALSEVVSLKRARGAIPTYHDGAVAAMRGTAGDGVLPRPGASPAATTADFLADRRRALERISADGRGGIARGDRTALSPQWLVQSSTDDLVLASLPWRMLVMGSLFTASGLLAAPFTLRYVESQVGMLLVHGSVWSLAGGLAARHAAFCVAQALVAKILVAWHHHRTKGEPPTVMRAASPSAVSGLCDWRHPYYTFMTIWIASSLLAHAASTPVLNRVLAFHFGPARPGVPPVRQMMRGAVSLAWVSPLLPYPAAWLAVYETVNAFVLPTPASFFRPRIDLLESGEWKARRAKHVTLAMLTTLAVDAAVYPIQARVWRTQMRDLYAPLRSPCYGRRLFSGFSHRLAASAVTFSSTLLGLTAMGAV